MIQCQLKLKLRPAQSRMLDRWLWHLTGVYNWALRKIELDAKHGIYHTAYDIKALLNGHGSRVGIPVEILGWTAAHAHLAWTRCFRGISRRPRFKGHRNKLNSIPLSRSKSVRVTSATRAVVAGIGSVVYHKQDIPAGRMKGARLIKRASGWYLNLIIEAEPAAIPATAHGRVGIDPGFSALITLSTGEKVEHPNELRRSAGRLAQAQRGNRRQLTARLHERIGNQRKDRNHKLSRRLVCENALIVWSADNTKAVAQRFGKSVTAAAHSELRRHLAYKSSSCGRRYIEVSNRNSTRTCSACGALSGPAGLAGLSVREWACACGATHDRDVNAAVNTLALGLGISLERTGDGSLGIATMQHGDVQPPITGVNLR